MVDGLQAALTTDWLMIFALGIFQLDIPNVMYTTALKFVPAIDAILVGMIEQVFNPVWVYLFIGETIGDWAFIGGILVLGGSLGRRYSKYRLSRN